MNSRIDNRPGNRPHSRPDKQASIWQALADGRHSDPFALLGLHLQNGVRIVRTLQPQAKSVTLLDRLGKVLRPMRRVHAGGIFEAPMADGKRRYQLRIESKSGGMQDIEDAYRLPSMLGDLDLHLMSEGNHQQLFNKLGAQPTRLLGLNGSCFAVWAPNALRVSVVGDFNDWDGRRHVMRVHPGSGVWEIFIPGVCAGALYKYEILDRQGDLLPLKSDPMAHFFEPPPGNASIVYRSHHRWRDQTWMQQHRSTPRFDQPLSIYEVHLGSWRRRADGRALSYRELARELVAYVVDLGFTHIELMPVTEHPFDGSWGYQPIGLYAPTQRFGAPDDFRHLIDCCHRAGIAVIMDWVPAHFPRDAHGLGRFDGSALYEHQDPRQGEHADWGTLIFNYGRGEVINYLVGSALCWIDEFHIDALRVDAVAAMLYLDYSRAPGEWVANRYGGNENLEAVDFIRRLNIAVHARGACCFAEESTAWPGVSQPTDSGGLGFTYKWNMGWMNDTLAYMRESPMQRKHHHDNMTFGLVYAFSENFVLPLSHDEVVHGKGSLLGRMPGDDWQRFANLRAYFGFMYAYPGKKLLFMGAEIAQENEWNHQRELDWRLLEQPRHRKVQALVRDLNHVYRATAALHQQDCKPAGFEWIDWQDRDHSVLSWIRRAGHGDGDGGGGFVICICNFTAQVHDRYRIGVPAPGDYREIMNTDAARYGGSDLVNAGLLRSQRAAAHGHGDSLVLTVPPLATLILQPQF
ncbi:1,4-alpha-glucan branching protein GlgB [Candidatus Spongiihabitans sp.]|uniref:1,4-alpha-glucan branching protein GlgB n=1 Tax=Candidatus Spongiihabitans sp. TaxID=3101308 RepID=UPI003C7E36F2